MPLGLLILAILLGEAAEHPVTVLGYAVWLCSLAWSPEAGVYATIVWFPYLALRTAQRRGATTAAPSLRFARGGNRCGISCSRACEPRVNVSGGLGDWPSASGFLTYIRNPRGSCR